MTKPSKKEGRKERTEERLRLRAAAKEQAAIAQTQQQLAAMSHRRKMERARHHIEAATATVEAFHRSVRYELHEPSPGMWEMLGRADGPWPTDLPLIVGDAVACLRQSLDHLVFALAYDADSSMTEADARGVTFPMPDKPPTKMPSGLRKVKAEPADAILSMIKKGAPASFQEHPLWYLNQLSNRDKHRLVTVVHSAVSLGGIGGSGFNDWLKPSGPMSLEADGSVVLARMGPMTAKLSLSGQASTYFGPGTVVEGWPVIDVLREWSRYIEAEVFEPLETFLVARQ